MPKAASPPQKSPSASASARFIESRGLNGALGSSAASTIETLLVPTAPGDADFLVALQKAVIELAVGVDLALQDAVLDAAALEVERLRLELFELVLQARLLRLGRLVVGAQASP